MSAGESDWSRRRFLAAAAAASAAACGDEASAPADASDARTRDVPVRDAGEGRADAEERDAASDAPPASDAGPSPDTSDAADASDTSAAPDAPDAVRGAAEDLADAERPQGTKGPFMHVLAAEVGEAPRLRWRVESRGEATLSLHVTDAEGGAVYAGVSAVTSADVDFAWPPSTAVTVENRDEPGRYSVHEWVLSPPEGARGARLTWEVRGLRGGPVSGSVRVPPAAGEAYRVGWVSDTMFPTSVPVAEQLAAQGCDLLLHGGDIQYQSNPLDTWNGYFAAFADAHRHAPMHYCVGNHEYENVEEVDAMTTRLFGLEVGGYQAFTYAGWRWILMNSERGFGVDTHVQMRFLVRELDLVENSPDLRGAVCAFHRPYYTLSRSRPDVDARASVHPRLRDAGVKLVLTGHNHCYERFEVEGVTYIMDGGGGAGLYNPDHYADLIESERPGEGALRVVSERRFGLTVMDVGADGRIEGRRVRDTGEESDRWTVG